MLCSKKQEMKIYKYNLPLKEEEEYLAVSAQYFLCISLNFLLRKTLLLYSTKLVPKLLSFILWIVSITDH